MSMRWRDRLVAHLAFVLVVSILSAAAPFSPLGSQPAAAETGGVFSDDFETETPGADYDGFANWSVPLGTVDLIGGSYFPELCPDTNCVDLAGSAGAANTDFVTSIPLASAGVYELSFDLAGSQRAGFADDVLSLFVEAPALGQDLIDDEFQKAAADPFETITRTFDLSEPATVDLNFFHVTGADNVGLLLDNVTLTLVAEHRTVTIGSFGGPTAESGYALTESLLTVTKGYLEDGGSFGFGGVEPYGFEVLPGVQSVAPEVFEGEEEIEIEVPDPLDGVDIFFTGWVGTGSYTQAETDALVDFVRGGGALVITADDRDHNPAVPASEIAGLDIFGNVHGDFFSASLSPSTVSDPTHPIADGPFGTVTSFVGDQFIGSYASLGPDTVEIFNNRDLEASPTGSTLAVIPPGALVEGSGPVIFVADVNVFVGGAATTNETLIKNLFAYAATFTVEEPEPPSGTFSLAVTNTGGLVEPGATVVPTSALPPSALTTAIADDATTVDGLASTPLSSIPLSSIPLSSIPLSSIPLSSIPLSSIPLSSIPLSDVPGGWAALLLGTDLAGLPLQNVTFGEALAAAESTIGALPLSSIDLADTPLSSIPLSSIALGALPLSSIPLSSIDLDPLIEWCASPEGDPGLCTDLGDANLLELTIAGAPLSSIPLSSIPLSSIPLSSIPLSSIPLSSIDLADTPLSSIPLSSIPLSSIPLSSIPLSSIPLSSIPLSSILIAGAPLSSIPLSSIGTIADCTAVDCGTATLGDAAAAGALLGDLEALVGALAGAGLELTLGELLEGFFADGQFTTAQLGELLQALLDAGVELTLGDILAGLLPDGAYQWERLDLDAVNLAEFASGGGVVTYQADFSVVNTDTAEISITLPDGFTYVAGSALVDGVPFEPGYDPVADPQVLGWTVTGLVSGAPSVLTFGARPGLDLETVQATGSLAVAGGSGDIGDDAVTVIEAFEGGGATAVAEDTIYVGHIATAGDTDTFEIYAPAGSRITVSLGNADVDLDLVLYKPAGTGRLRGEPERRVIAVDDPGGSPAETESEVVDDIPIRPDRIVDSISANRGTADEQILTDPLRNSGTYLIQVTGYNGATSTGPYTLRVGVEPGSTAAACSARTFPNLGDGVAGTPAVLPDGVTTLFLWNQQWFGDTYGAPAAADVLAAMNLVGSRGDLGVIGAVIAVESDPVVAAAYANWQSAAYRCDPGAANVIASAIGNLVDTLRAANPTINNVVIVGGDEIVPFFRVPDETAIANERDYATTFAGLNNELVGSLSLGFVQTDDPYVDPRPWDAEGREIFLPEIPIGRLVENPADIAAALLRFDEFDGLLDPATTTSAYVAGYDFLIDGSEAVAERLAATGRPVDTDIDDIWTALDLGEGFLTNNVTIVSPNAHYDHNRALPADQDARGIEEDLFTTLDVAASTTADLFGDIIFTMGCHAGQSVSDIQIGGWLVPLTTTGDAPALSNDWAQLYGSEGAVYFANTGYGYGDTEVVEYSERLMAYFAEGLDGSLTVGEAVTFAKQRFAGEKTVFSPYEDKVLMQAVFYGLPMYRVEGTGFVPEPAPPLPTSSDPGSTLTVASFGIELDPGAELEEVATDRGSYYRVNDTTLAGSANPVNGGVQATALRPLQPQLSFDVTQEGLSARGALITALSSTDVDLFDPVVSRPTIDLAANEPEPELSGIFPSALQAVRGIVTPGGERDQVVIVPGQFRSTTGTIGVQRLFTGIEGTVYYTDPGNPDTAAPAISRTGGIVTGNSIAFSVKVDDPAGVIRVYVLYRDGADWVGLDLAQSGGRWTGAGPISGAQDPEYWVQAVDAAGNVAVSSNKGELYLSAEPPAPAPAPSIDLTLSGANLNGGFYDGAVTVTVDTDDTLGVEIDVDGAGFAAYTAPVVVSGEGPHAVTVRALSSDDEVVEFFLIDAADPTVTIFSPADLALYFAGEVPDADFTCADGGSGVAGCTGTVADGDPLPQGTGVSSVSVTATDELGNETTVTHSYLVVEPASAALSPADDPGAIPFVATGATVVGSAVFTDIAGAAVTWDWGDGTTDAPGTHTYSEPGIYEVTATVTYPGYGSLEAAAGHAFVHGSTRGWVTGGGWQGDKDAKSTFGFVAKYKVKRGDVDARGSLVYRNREIGFRFKTTSIDWLVISDGVATFGGEGKVGRDRGYGFVVSAGDGPDRFRITIWDPATGDLFFDSEPGADRYAAATQEIRRGAVVVRDGTERPAWWNSRPGRRDFGR